MTSLEYAIYFSCSPFSFLDILRETLEILHSSNSQFHSARQDAGNDMLKYMRVVFPIATKTQMMVLAKHGHTDPDGR